MTGGGEQDPGQSPRPWRRAGRPSFRAGTILFSHRSRFRYFNVFFSYGVPVALFCVRVSSAETVTGRGPSYQAPLPSPPSLAAAGPAPQQAFQLFGPKWDVPETRCQKPEFPKVPGGGPETRLSLRRNFPRGSQFCHEWLRPKSPVTVPEGATPPPRGAPGSAFI